MNGVIEGKIVHFIFGNGKQRPAIITNVLNESLCNLTVFVDYANDANCAELSRRDISEGMYHAKSIKYSNTQEPGTFHFLEDEKAEEKTEKVEVVETVENTDKEKTKKK